MTTEGMEEAVPFALVRAGSDEETSLLSLDWVCTEGDDGTPWRTYQPKQKWEVEVASLGTFTLDENGEVMLDGDAVDQYATVGLSAFLRAAIDSHTSLDGWELRALAAEKEVERLRELVDWTPAHSSARPILPALIRFKSGLVEEWTSLTVKLSDERWGHFLGSQNPVVAWMLSPEWKP